MDTLNEYLKGKNFILYTDHKPLEKMRYFHRKTMNRLHSALLEHDFMIQYIKGTILPADYLSRLPSTNSDQLAEATQCFDPFQPELIDFQKAYPDLQKMNHLRTKGEWPAYVTKADGRFTKSGGQTFPRCQMVSEVDCESAWEVPKVPEALPLWNLIC
jgi:hypothetical protein